MSSNSRFPRSQAAIVGIGRTEYSKNSGVSQMALAAAAVKAAVADAGLTVRDVDGLATFGLNDSTNNPNILAQALGIQDMHWYMEHNWGGSVAMTGIAQAALAVSAGIADCVVCYRALNGRSGGGMRSMKPGQGVTTWDAQYKAGSGYIAPAQEVAMAARAHMVKYGTTEEDFGRIAVLCRTNAVDNERAIMRSPLTLDDYFESRWIAEPFRILDCCLESDGAAAVVVVSAERAKDLPHRAAFVRGAAWGGGKNLVNNHHTDFAESPGKGIAQRVYANAGLGPEDMDFAELYDCFTFTTMSQLEGYGFAEPGTVGSMLEAGAFDRHGGQLPFNTHGGLLSEAYVHAINHVYEAVEQMRGDAEHRQVAKHDVALVTGQLGYLSAYSSAIVLEGA
jgi:acetyl-CoA acetyltransferase